MARLARLATTTVAAGLSLLAPLLLAQPSWAQDEGETSTQSENTVLVADTTVFTVIVNGYEKGERRMWVEEPHRVWRYETTATPTLPTTFRGVNDWSSTRRDFPSHGDRREAELRVSLALGLRPKYVWLDEDGATFADEWSVLSGWEEVFPDLRAASEQALAEHHQRLADDLAPPGRTRPLVLQNARLFDPETGTVRPHTTIVIEGNRITAVGPDGRVDLPSGAERLEAGGKTVLPGLWDMHAPPGKHWGRAFYWPAGSRVPAAAGLLDPWLTLPLKRGRSWIASRISDTHRSRSTRDCPRNWCPW